MPSACAMRPKSVIRNAGHPVDRGETIELERIDDEVKAVRHSRSASDWFGVDALYCGRTVPLSPLIFFAADEFIVPLSNSRMC